MVTLAPAMGSVRTVMAEALAVGGGGRVFRTTFANCDLEALGMSRQHYHRFGTLHPFDRTDRTDQSLERGGVIGFHFEEESVFASDVMAFEDIVELLYSLLEITDQSWVVDGNADKGCDGFAQATL